MEKIINSRTATNILIYLYKKIDQPTIISDISFDLRKTYSCIHSNIKLLKQYKLIDLNKVGRNNFVKLNQKGIETTKEIVKLYSL